MTCFIIAYLDFMAKTISLLLLIRRYTELQGQGFHEYRERLITREWFWQQTQESSEMLCQHFTKEEAETIITQYMTPWRNWKTYDDEEKTYKLFK